LFDISLQFSAEAPAVNPIARPSGPSDAPGPSVFEALQDQLGLRLEATKGPVEVLVIDSVQRPSEN
jgi:uncharacterized protein (TIGR03435 family)